MKTIKTVGVALVVIAGLFFAVVFGINKFLAVDDLKGCGPTPSSKTGCQTADAIVAISGGDTAARTKEAIALYKNGWGNKLIFSGAAADTSGPSNAEVMERQAINAGVDTSDIVTESISKTTTENAAETSNIFTEHQIKSAIVVTSAYHERRAMLEFNKRALGVKISGHPVANDKQWSKHWWLSATGWSLAIPETVRSLVLMISGKELS